MSERTEWQAGDSVWVFDPDEQEWHAGVVEDPDVVMGPIRFTTVKTDAGQYEGLPLTIAVSSGSPADWIRPRP